MSKTIIMKPTHDCNLACSYCYVEEGFRTAKMSSETLENSFDKMLNHFGEKERFEFLWHGGEPLLAGLAFYESVVELTDFYRGKGFNIRNSMQTNGTLLSGKFLEYLTHPNHDFSLGFSLDGPEHVHNLTRKYKSGLGSFDLVFKNIMEYKKIKKRAGAISVITKQNIDFIDDIYNFFKENKMSFKANPLITVGHALSNYEDLSITPIEYGNAMIRLFDLWFYDKNPDFDSSVDNLESLVRTKLTGKTFGCNYSSSCQNSFFSINPQGDVYPCGRFDETTGYMYGNINTDSIDDIASSSVRQMLSERSKRISECQSCKFFGVCNSGCMHNAFMKEGDSMDKDSYCQSYKMIFNHVFSAVDSELDYAEVVEYAE